LTDSSRHVTSLTEGQVQLRNDFGSITAVNADRLEILDGLSLKRLLLQPGSIREPHWHANATEMTYCVSGAVLVSILGSGNDLEGFLVKPGQMFFVPCGALHHVENVGSQEAELILAFRHERPSDFSLRSSMAVMSDAVLGNTYDLPASDFEGVPREVSGPRIVGRTGAATIPEGAGLETPFRFDVEGESPPIDTAAGSARLARSQFWPALTDISMYSLRITDVGMREPHWHPETAEMGFVKTGRGRMTVLDPDGQADTYELGPGDVYFIPRAYPHHIENIGGDEMHFLIFFDQPMPKDIGFRASASAISREVLASTLGIPAEQLPNLPFTPVDPLLVDRKNAIDET